MTNRTTNLIHTSTMNILRLALLSSLVFATPLFASSKHSGQGQDGRAKAEQARLVQLVRNATKNYQDISNLPPGYGPFLGCVSGPDHGAMGVHYVNGDLVGDGKIDVSQPEALIYETANGQTKLVGADASHAWASFFCPGIGWIDVDPTNNLLPSMQHITLGWGRDYDDISPVRGVLTGGDNHRLKVGVDVTARGDWEVEEN